MKVMIEIQELRRKNLERLRVETCRTPRCHEALQCVEYNEGRRVMLVCIVSVIVATIRIISVNNGIVRCTKKFGVETSSNTR